MLVSQSEPGECEVCPSEAKCLGGSKMGPREGYWRPSNTTSTFKECPNRRACLGMINALSSEMGECA